MSFLAELEEKIQSYYSKVLKEKLHENIPQKTFYCDSFGKITETVKQVLIEGTRDGWDVDKTANTIIFTLLQKNFFMYENHRMALLIGYMYMKRQGVEVTHYSPGKITNDSTIEEIRALTKSWV